MCTHSGLALGQLESNRRSQPRVWTICGLDLDFDLPTSATSTCLAMSQLWTPKSVSRRPQSSKTGGRTDSRLTSLSRWWPALDRLGALLPIHGFDLIPRPPIFHSNAALSIIFPKTCGWLAAFLGPPINKQARRGELSCHYRSLTLPRAAPVPFSRLACGGLSAESCQLVVCWRRRVGCRAVAGGYARLRCCCGGAMLRRAAAPRRHAACPLRVSFVLVCSMHPPLARARKSEGEFGRCLV